MQTLSSVKNIFRELKLSDEHAQVYLACLESGTAPASLIAKKARLPRSSVYYLLEDLVKIGLVSLIEGEGKKIFMPAPPQVLTDLTSQKQKSLQNYIQRFELELPKLQSLFARKQPQFPSVSFFQGEAGLKTVYYDALAASEILIICQGSSSIQTSLADDPQYLKDFIRECTLRKIPTRELLQDTPAAREYQKKYQSRTHQIIITHLTSHFPPPKFGHVDKHIYQAKLAFIAHDSLVGIIIEDETLFQSERVLFETLWKYYQDKKNFSN